MRENYNRKTLVVLTGPTGVGKTLTSIELAGALQTEIISADARQFFKELKIGTAAPTQEELAAVPHHLAGHLSIFDYYNVSLFEQQALSILDTIFLKSDYAILTGGSGLYIDALCHGIDQLPDANPAIRNKVKNIYQQLGLEGLQEQLSTIDPEYFSEVDIHNPNRMMRGLEVYYSTGEKFSNLRKNTRITRPFKIKKVIINRPRHELFDRINARTHLMVQQGLVEEAVQFFPLRELNALNTVGYKELFGWLENRWPLHTALEKIQTNTRRYAKRQLTWFKRYEDARWFMPHEINSILSFIKEGQS